MRKNVKIILLKNVPNLGGRGDVKDVSLGYARNFLIPQGLAEEATPEKIKTWEEIKTKELKNAEADLAQAEKLVKQLEGQVVEITAKASEEGRLYAAVSPAKIAAAFKTKGFDVKKDQIKAEHIKELGEHEITVSLDHGLEARVTLTVNSE